jgi:magnesium-protoporphyrin IX monomethyl ester (oxidative) cyclase
MYSEIYLRLEPLGLERVAAAALQANHDVRILDLQIFGHHDFARELLEFAPEVIAFSLNYLANVPEVLDLAKRTKALQRNCSVVVGGHSASFIADELLKHGQGAIDCVVRGEGEAIMPRVLEAIGDRQLHRLPGVVTLDGHGPAPLMLEHLDGYTPARHLARRRKKYFIGVLDPCASIEFTRGCPWDCSFCSAWTFYGRSYRKSSAAAVAEDLVSINEPNVFQMTAHLADKIGITKRQAKSALDELNELVVKQLKKEGLLRLAGLGVFRKRKLKARMGRNPATGEQIKIPARTRLRFTPAKALKDSVLGAR